MTQSSNSAFSRSILAICLASLFAGCASSPQSGQSDAQQRQIERAITALERRGDADSFAMAALFSLGKHRDESLTLIARAAAIEPNRSDLVMLQAQMCRKLGHCDPEPIELRLRQLDPGNGEGRMGDLTRATASGDEGAASAALAEISRSDRIDMYYTTLIARLTRAAANTKSLSIGDADVIVIGYLAAEPIFGYSAASKR